MSVQLRTTLLHAPLRPHRFQEMLEAYQMSVYAKKNSCEQIVMIYSIVESLPNDVRDIQYTDGDITMNIYLFDCVNEDKDVVDFLENLDSQQLSFSNTSMKR